MLGWGGVGGRRPERRLLTEDILYTYFFMEHGEKGDFLEFTRLWVHVCLWKWVGACARALYRRGHTSFRAGAHHVSTSKTAKEWHHALFEDTEILGQLKVKLRCMCYCCVWIQSGDQGENKTNNMTNNVFREARSIFQPQLLNRIWDKNTVTLTTFLQGTIPRGNLACMGCKVMQSSTQTHLQIKHTPPFHRPTLMTLVQQQDNVSCHDT